jgi:hypothetical protein
MAQRRTENDPKYPASISIVRTCREANAHKGGHRSGHELRYAHPRYRLLASMELAQLKCRVETYTPILMERPSC